MDVTYFASYREDARGVTSRSFTCRSFGIWPAMPHRLEQIAGPMSALPPKADKQQTCRDVRFVPIGDICSAAKQHIYSITSVARSKMDVGTVRPSAVALLRLTTTGNLVGACTGRSA